MDESALSLNSTFCIDDDESYLSNFGTPLNFKKLLERPATVAASTRMRHNNHPGSFKKSSNDRLNNNYLFKNTNLNNDLNLSFQSPFNNNLTRQKLSFMSPINYNEQEAYEETQYNSPDNNSLFKKPESSFNIRQKDDSKIKHVTPRLSWLCRDFTPPRDSAGNVMMSSARKLSEERKQNKAIGEISPREKERYMKIIFADAKRLEMINMINNNSKENFEESPILSFLTPLKKRVGLESPISPMDYHKTSDHFMSPSPRFNNQRLKIDVLHQAQVSNTAEKPRLSYLLREFSPPRDSAGNVMMSTAKKLSEERKRAKAAGEISPRLLEEFRNIMIADAKKIDMTFVTPLKTPISPVNCTPKKSHIFDNINNKYIVTDPPINLRKSPDLKTKLRMYLEEKHSSVTVEKSKLKENIPMLIKTDYKKAKMLRDRAEEDEIRHRSSVKSETGKKAPKSVLRPITNVKISNVTPSISTKSVRPNATSSVKRWR